MDCLLAWLDDPPTGRGIRFAGQDGCWDFWPYDRLAEMARGIAWGLVRGGVADGEVVTVALGSGPSFVATLFGTMLAGATPSPVAPRLLFQDPAVFVDRLSGMFRAARPAAVVTDSGLAATVEGLAAAAGVPATLTVDVLLAGAGTYERLRPPGRSPAELALLQFTSGSSGHPRGVRVPFSALEANLAAMTEWVRMTEVDPTASWLPVHHDMGLVGCLLTPIVNRCDLWLLQPEQFVQNPARYLRCFGAQGARITAMPNFGLDYIARRVRPSALAGLNFSEWRAVIVGAERIDPVALDRFHALLAPHGLRRAALLPAYGLAEGTLAVTGLALDEEWTSMQVDPGSVRVGRRLRPAADGALGQAVVGCGRQMASVSIAIVGEDGESLPEGHVGEISARGASVAAGYIGDGESASLTRFVDGDLRSGDAGFILDGQLYVLGRLGDSVKVRGRAVFAEDLEAALESAGVGARWVGTALGLRHGRPTVVAVFEQPAGAWIAEADRLLRRRAEGAEVVLVLAPRGTIERTMSGKVKRRRLWQAFCDGSLPGTVTTASAVEA